MIDSFRGPFGFLSNFAPSPIREVGITYPTLEHYFQAHKASDPATRAVVAKAATPAFAKALGRRVPIIDNWDQVKLTVMRHGLELKFEPGTTLAVLLLGTGDQLLQEGNTWGDTFWGVTPRGGANWLGHLLMARRAELRAAE